MSTGVKERFARSCGVRFALFVSKSADVLSRASILVAAAGMLMLLLPDPNPIYVILPLAGLPHLYSSVLTCVLRRTVAPLAYLFGPDCAVLDLGLDKLRS